METSSFQREEHESHYNVMLTSFESMFQSQVHGYPALFMTDAKDLWQLYLENIPEEERQIHNCRSCQRFIETYGGLVTVESNGTTYSVMWDRDSSLPKFYWDAFAMLDRTVNKAQITSVFCSKANVWGIRKTGPWTHLALDVPQQFVFHERMLSAEQAMAKSKEDFNTVHRALLDLSPEVVNDALRIMESELFSRSEKFLGPIKWLQMLKKRPNGRAGDNLLWLAAATAPDGYMHPKASVIGPLLQDLTDGLPFQIIKERWEAMVKPTSYMRPTAPPSVGNIRAAEEIVAKLGIAPSLERRFARLDEIPTIWTPAAQKAPKDAGGVFGHLTPKGVSPPYPMALPRITMTWDKFLRAVLPAAEEISVYSGQLVRFFAFTTAVNADAPPIIKWDHEQDRNPFTWYTYTRMCPAFQWNIVPNSWCKLTAVASFPTMWGANPMPHLGQGYLLVVEGAVDNRATSNSLFPEMLKSPLHEVRATIEAYSRTATLAGKEQASACGVGITQNAVSCVLSVLSNGARTEYNIDRWD